MAHPLITVSSQYYDVNNKNTYIYCGSVLMYRVSDSTTSIF